MADESTIQGQSKENEKKDNPYSTNATHTK